MEIIQIKDADDYGYKSFFRQGLAAHADKFRIDLTDELTEPFPTTGKEDSFTLGIIDEQQTLLGVVSFKRSDENRKKLRHKGLLFRMYVAANQSVKGVGKLLLRELINRVKKVPDIEQINLTVVAHNTNAIRLYTSFGFETFAQEKNALKQDSETYFTELQMSLKL